MCRSIFTSSLIITRRKEHEEMNGLFALEICTLEDRESALTARVKVLKDYHYMPKFLQPDEENNFLFTV